MPGFEALDIDSALSLMNTAPTAPAIADWTPTDAPAAELPPEPKAAEQAPPADAGADTTADDKGADAATDQPADQNAPDDEGKTTEGQSDQGDALPIIEPPNSWKAEEKEVFKSLPRLAQEAILRREQDRTNELRNLQNSTAEQRKQLDGEVTKLQGLTSQIDAVVKERVDDLAREFPEVKTQADIEALAQRDPARFSVFQAKLMRFNEAQRAQQAAQQELQVRAAEQQQQVFAQAREAILKEFPTWSDPAVGRKEMTELQDYAISLGVPEQSARQAIDPFVYKLAQKARLYDQAQAAKSAAVNREPPRVVKPGTSNSGSKADRQAQGREAQLRKLEKSGDIMDAIGLLRG